MLGAANVPRELETTLSELSSARILPRIWAGDYTVWKPSPAEISNRLGWLRAPEIASVELERMERFTDRTRADEISRVLLLGMGGSSLAPETFSATFGNRPGFPELAVLDSTHPDAVHSIDQELNVDRTLFLVATKSGTTPETLALFRHFYNRVSHEMGTTSAGDRFVAITDPASPLVDIAAQCGFRETFLSDPNVGGRYSALSLFGLVPAALLGVDVRRFLARARSFAAACEAQDDPRENPASYLGAILGACARSGRDKATFVLSEPIASFGDWVEQLIAESTGKEGTGILPVVGEPLGTADVYGGDRLFVHLRLADDDASDGRVEPLAAAGHPVIQIDVDEPHALGEQFFLWELATAVAGHVLRINPFEQPSVETAKALTRKMITEYLRVGTLPAAPCDPLSAHSLVRSLADVEPDGYIAVHAYLPPSSELASALGELRTAIRDRFRTATTIGFGPRFLHSTGQLHKGDRGNGRFVQLVDKPMTEIPIPDAVGEPASSLTFGTLIAAQAHGDRQALLDVNRAVTTFAVPPDRVESIRRAAAGIQERGISEEAVDER